MANDAPLDRACEDDFGITPRRYRQLSAEGIVPKPEKGKIDYRKAARGLIGYYRRLAESQGGLSLTDERTRLTKINADKKALDLEMARGELIETARAQAMWGAVMQNVVNKLDNVSSKLAPLVHGLSIPETKAVADKMIDEVKNEIANPDLSEIARMASRKRNVKPGPAKAAPKRKRVGGSKPDVKSGGKRRAR